MTAPITPNDDHDLRQLTGAFDRPIAPSPHFAGALKQRLQAEGEAAQGKPTTIPQMAPISRRTRQHAYEDERMDRRWLSVAAASIFVLTLLGGTIWYASGRFDTTHTAGVIVTHYAAPPLDVTPDANAAIELAGDPGYTNVWPGSVDTSTTYVAAPFGNPQMSATVGIVVDDSLVFTGWPADSIPEESPVKLYRQDLIGGEVLWESDINIAGRITTDGASLFALTYPTWPPGPNESPMLSAISPDDGTIIWQSPPLAGYAEEPRPEAPKFPTEPIAIDGQVYVGLDNGLILSFDGRNGDVAWTYAGGMNAPDDRVPMITSLIGNPEHVFAVMPDTTIVTLDRLSGTLVDTIELPEKDRHLNNVQLHLQNDRLVITANAYDEDNQDAMLMVVIDAETGAPIWSTDLEPIAGEIAVTSTMIGVPQAQRNERPFLVQLIPGIRDATWDVSTLFLDIESGELIARIESDSEYGWIPLSGSGEVICMADDAVTCIDRDGNQTTVEGIDLGSEGSLFNPVLYHDGRIIIFGHDIPIHIAAPE